MRLRTNIFLWVTLATVLPLTALVLVVTASSERLYSGNVDREIAASLTTLTTEINRRLSLEREVFVALANATPMQAYKRAMEEVLSGDRPPQFNLRTLQLGHFLREFMALVPGVGTVRVLDPKGNTVLMVRDGRLAPNLFQGVDPYPYAEEELADEAFLQRLRGIPPGEVSYVMPPRSRSDFVEGAIQPMYDAVIPMPNEDAAIVVGYLMVNSTGLQIDRILELAQRLAKGRITVAEINPDSVARDTLMLYDDALPLLFSAGKDPRLRLDSVLGAEMLASVRTQSFGIVDVAVRRSRIYYHEYLPYPNQLVSWVIATEIDRDAVAAPFKHLRQAILWLAVLTVAAGLLLASLSARRIAGPVTRLARNLKAYARGEAIEPLPPQPTQEIRELQQAFDYMAETLEKAHHRRDEAERMLLQSAKLASIGEMAAGIGHEINNPLNNVLQLARLIERELPPDAEQPLSDLRALREEAERATRIISGILNFARQVPPQYETIHAPFWLDETLALVRQAARERDVRLNRMVDADLRFEGDPNQLRQVMINLLLNAIQASKAGDEVIVMAGEGEDGGVHLCVCDQGSGVDPEIQDKLFDPFFTTKPVGKGSGLGLSVSLGIVQHHGGRIELRNNERGGVTATVHLPRRS
ncbi:MAG: HAMP domain-containing sensor histidine kinase [Ectothiorhodospiraceae bacterium]|nr:HAMP domain-containing sensor histidine kinase [Ectothiorhodospiraceae bacterium]